MSNKSNNSGSWSGILVIILIVGLAKSKTENQNQEVRSHDAFCNCDYTYTGEKLKLSSPDDLEAVLLDRILEVSGIPVRPYKLCKTANIPGSVAAFATNFNNKPYIVYESKYFDSINKDDRYWTSAWILGHEVGHHVSGHVYGPQPEITTYEKELEAERFSAAVMYKLGADYQQMISIISRYREERTATHPGRSERLAAFKEIWAKQGHVASSFNRQVPQPKDDEGYSDYEEPPMDYYDESLDPEDLSEQNEAYPVYKEPPAGDNNGASDPKDLAERGMSFALCTAINHNLSIWKEPSRYSDNLGHIPPGTRLRVIKTGIYSEEFEERGQWWLIEFKSTVGYCSSEFLQLE